MDNPILFEDLIAYKDIEAGLKKLTNAVEKFGTVAVNQNERYAKTVADLKADLTDLTTTMSAFATKGGVEKIKGLKDDFNGLATGIRSNEAALKRNQTALDQNTASIDAMKRRVTDLKTEYDSLDHSEAKNQARRKQIISEVKQLSTVVNAQTQAMRQATQSITNAERSYNALDRQTEQLRTDLKGLSGAFDEHTGKLNKNNKAAVEMQARIDANDKALKRMDKSMGIGTRSVGLYSDAFKGLAGQLVGVTSVAAAIAIAFNGVKAAIGIAEDMNRYDAALQAVSRDSNDFSRSHQFLLGLANKLGLQYGNLVESYKGLKASTKDTNLEGRATEKIFASIATAGAKLRLSNEAVEGSLRAISKMVSSGNVQMDELRSELGEHLPGALRLMSEALGISQGELNKMVEKGQILAVDVLPKFADAVDKAYGLKQNEKIENLTASANRFKTEVDSTIQTLSNSSGITSFFKAIYDGFGHSLRALRLFVQDGSWTEFIQFVGPNSFSNATARRMRIEDARLSFGNLDAKGRKAELDRLAKLEVDQRKKGDEIAANETDILRRKLRADALKLEVQDMQEGRTKIAFAEKDAIEKNENDIARFQKQAVRKRTADIIALEKQIAADNKKGLNTSDLQTKLNLYRGLDADQKAKDKAVTDRLKSEKGDSASKILSDSLSMSSAKSANQLENLSGKRADGLIDEQAYIEQRLKITLAGLNERQAILEKAGKKETDDYLKIQTEKLKADTEFARAQMQLDLKNNKGNTDKLLAGLDRQRVDEDIDDLTYTDHRHELIVAGIKREQAILKEAGQEKTELFKATDAALNEEQADYISKRLVVVKKAWKDELSATKEGLTEIDRQTGEGYQNRLVKIAEYYNSLRNEIEVAQAGGKINSYEAQNQLHIIDLNQLQAELTAYREVVATSKQLTSDLIQDHIYKLENYISYSGASEKELAETKKEIADLEKLQRESDAKDQMNLTKKVTENSIEQSNKKHQNVVDNAKKEEEMQKKLAETYMEIGNTIVDGLFSIQRQETENRLTELNARQEAELALVGDNEGAKAEITKKYENERKQIQHQQDQQARDQALFRILIDTATAVIKTFAEFGFPAGIPLAAAQAALGAIQAGIVASTPLPAYFVGKNIDGITNDNYAGPATISEQGRELWQHNGQWDLIEKPSIVNVGRNDTILPNWLTERFLNDRNAIESNRILGSLHASRLANRQLTEGRNNYNAEILSRAFKSGPSAKQIGLEVAKALANNPTWSLSLDKRGFNLYQQEAATRREEVRNKHQLGKRK
jgi:tape measure domain-containing protein